MHHQADLYIFFYVIKNIKAHGWVQVVFIAYLRSKVRGAAFITMAQLLCIVYYRLTAKAWR